MTWAEVNALQDDLMNPRTYESAPVVQIDELGDGLMIYSPYGFRPFARIVALSPRGVAAAFTTTVELDTSIRAAKNGKLIRDFDPFFYDRHERKGALPEEKGLGFGNRQTPFARLGGSSTASPRCTLRRTGSTTHHTRTYVLTGRY